MNVQIEISGFSNVEDPAVLEALRAAVSQLAVAAEQVGYPLRVFVTPEDAGRFVPAIPTVTGVAPTTAIVGGPDLTLHVSGTGFTESSVILFNAGAEATTFVSATELTTGVKPSLVSSPVIVPVSVVGATTAVDFTFTAPPAPPARVAVPSKPPAHG